MRVSIRLRPLLFICFTFIWYASFAQLSKTHYIPPLTNAEIGNANPEDQYIYISTPSNVNVGYTIIPVGQPITITGVVSNTNPQVEPIGFGNGQLFMASNQTSQVTNDKGYIIEAEAPIYVSIRMNAGGAQAGALVSKGISALGTIFRVGSFTNENPQINYLNFVSVMASEDNTQVDFSNLPTGLIIKNYTGTTPISVTLNKGESYTIATNSFDTPINRDGLIGSLVLSNKPIAVNCGSTNGSFHNGGGRDYGIDQIADLSKVGREYIFVKGGGSNDWENVLIVGHTDNTSISINGNAPVATINAGEYHLIEGNAYNSNGNMYVETSEDVFAYQGVGANNSEANQGMFFVPPLSCETRGNIDNIANIDRVGNILYSGGVTIVTKVGANVTINNLPLTSFSTIGPSTVSGNPNYITYKINGLTGHVSVQGDDELYVAYFNENNAATSGSFYSGFPSAPEINFDAQFATLGNCIPNVTLEAANAQNFDSYEWFYDNGSGFQLLASNVPSITPTIPARYKLVGIITCTLDRLESAIIPVSICPDDTDNDGIIDNIDIDNDNDGILNCTESKGDAIIDLSVIDPLGGSNTHEITFQDSSTNAALISGNYTQSSSSGGTNTFSGTSQGSFTSTVVPATDGEGKYNLNFSQSSNIKLEEETVTPHTITADEYFIVSVFPANKNITLIDPDNRLLVDSNFDGIFETGVNMISGSEIRFRVNPSPSGNTPYQFLANQIDGFTFTHKLANTTDTSTFNGIISLTCFENDNDSDGIKDELDLDSDNDGIPDFIENQGALVILSGIDADLNGLDDVYDITNLPIDTDNDGVLDFYDLDSDNDGIFDINEADPMFSVLSDTGTLGTDDGPVFGVNGWTDRAETAPDSNLINYTPDDTDNDGIFSYLDLDSDGDGCNDVIEAGFTDLNGNGLLGNTPTPVDVDPNGLVTGAGATDGYTVLPNNNFIIIAPITITTQPADTPVCEASGAIISVESPEAETYQWELSTDGINWSVLSDDATYSGATSQYLTINNVPLSFNGYLYRVKLDRTGNSCGIYSDNAQLTINPLPIVNSPVTLIQCDDDDLTTLGYSPFNLTEANNEISSNAANETFTYFLTQAAAISGDIISSDYISDPTTFINRTVSSDMVWARIESSFGCASVSEIQLNVSTTIIPSTFLATFNQCDDFLDIDGNDTANNDNRDGIATFDFSSVTSDILNILPGQNLLPKYYRNEADALAEKNEITNISNYRNIGYPGSQFIYVRIDSDITNDCLGLGAHVLLNVEALPIANPVTIAAQCDHDTSDSVINHPFDTSQIETTILGGQNPADVTITYFDEHGDPLPSPLPNPFLTESQDITVVVTNNVTSAPDGPCSDPTVISFVVNQQPIIANSISIQEVCDGDAGDTDNDGFYPFDTSTFTSTILGSQMGTMDIFYSYTDEDGNPVTESQTLPGILNSKDQIIQVEVRNPKNLTCIANTSIELKVNPLPEFTIETPRIVCSSDPTFSIVLDPDETNITESFDYEWLWTSLDGTITDQFESADSEITVSKPGTYTVTLTKKDGTGCSRTNTVFVDASELANITHDDVTIVDLKETNSVTIDPSNLGQGEYEYALKGEDSNFIIYQDEPFFNNVAPGFYTIFVKDKICGVASLDISVIGHAKYFTPNGDGYNDYWKIKGLSEHVQPNSVILIYDRYGKLLKQLQVQSEGWDGTFNGTRMPSDDYWFRVVLEDGRTFSGHFALKR
ncbi:T9SS type B sorting domain-containing protein [Tamlana sp. 2201CG12-4]|uniref:T9SS type B sorting domain-containing protein n=1 Tax=Tamlana sp. 2201CG12-4 TaxID=3112582 RepID=UPI002DB9AAF1|nr:T9SS type B sorting domain-containing protein [Tamlana sp. 2201CG12-4]MEC3907586.1 T9SS type B sorting domain-containing protein [Tamlana sp. 2201CG12-4]